MSVSYRGMFWCDFAKDVLLSTEITIYWQLKNQSYFHLLGARFNSVLINFVTCDESLPALNRSDYWSGR